MAPSFAVQTYRGSAKGWQTVSIRPADGAAKLAALLARVRPDYIHRIKPA